MISWTKRRRAAAGRARSRVGWLVAVALVAAGCAEGQIRIGGADEQATPPTPPPTAEPAEPVVAAAPATAPVAPVPVPVGPAGLRVALLVPLSGPQGAVGRDLLDAAQMALFDIAGEVFVLLPFDTGGTPEGAAAAADAALAAGAGLVLGPLLSASAASVAPIGQRAGVPVVAFTNDRAIAGNGVFVMGFVPDAQVGRVVRFAIAQGMRRFATLAPNDTYGAQLAGALERTVAEQGADVVAAAYYFPGDPEFEEVVKQLGRYDERRTALLEQRAALEERGDEISRRALKRLEKLDTLGEVGFEALLLPAYREGALQISPVLAFYDIDPGRIRLLGTWLWDDPSLGAEPALIGAWFAAPPPAARAPFVNRFRTLHNRLPDRRATLAYDAVALAAVLANEAVAAERGDRAFTMATLTAANGFAGLDGIFRLLPTGFVERGLAVLEIRRDGPHELDPAPQSFEELTN